MEPSRGKSLCVPFDSAEHYAACVADTKSYRQHQTAYIGQHPVLFPARMREGFVLHDKSSSIKQQVMLRRLELKATAEGFLVRPSFLMPSMVGSDGGRGKGSLSAPLGCALRRLGLRVRTRRDGLVSGGASLGTAYHRGQYRHAAREAPPACARR